MIFNILVLVLIFSCNKDEIIIDPNITIVKPEMDIVWSHKISLDSSIGFIAAPIIWGENVIYSTRYFLPQNTIQSRNLVTGILNWEQSSILLGKDHTNEFNYGIFQNELIWENHNDFLNIDLSNGMITNHDRVIDAWMGPRCSFFNNYIYSEISDKSIQQDKGFLVRREINGNHWDTLTTILKEDGYTPFLNMAIGSVSSKGDTLLLFSVGKWNFQQSKGQTDLYCLSLKDRIIKWRLKDWDKDGSSALLPTIYKNQVYFQGHHTLYCLDIESGKEKWRFEMPNYLEDLLICPILFAENKIYVKGENYNTLRCLDINSGQVIWQNTDVGVGTNKLQYAHGMIMFTAHHYLIVVNSSTGKTIWKKKSPNDKGDVNFNGWSPIGINVRDSIIYACDNQNIMAIKMPKIE